MLFRLGHRCCLLRLSSKVDICEANGAKWRMIASVLRRLSRCTYPLFAHDFDAGFPCKALAGTGTGRWTLVGSPMSAKKPFRASWRVFQLRLPTHTENPVAVAVAVAGFEGTSVVAASVFFCRFRAALLAACERMLAPATSVSSSSSSSNSALVRFAMRWSCRSVGVSECRNLAPTPCTQGLLSEESWIFSSYPGNGVIRLNILGILHAPFPRPASTGVSSIFGSIHRAFPCRFPFSRFRSRENTDSGRPANPPVPRRSGSGLKIGRWEN